MTERMWTTAIPSEDIPGILKTIRLFLENIKFTDTIKALEAEIKAHNFHCASISTPKFLILTPSSISTSCKKNRTDLGYYPVNIYPKCYRVHSVENATSPQDIDVCYAEEIHPHYEDSLQSISSGDKRNMFQKDGQNLMCVTFRLLESIKIQVSEYNNNEPEVCLRSTNTVNTLIDNMDFLLPKASTNYCKRVKTAENSKEFEEEVEINTTVLSTSDSNELSELYYQHFEEFEILNKSTNEPSDSFTKANWGDPDDPETQSNEENETTVEGVETTTVNRQMADCEKAADENNGRECCCSICMNQEDVMDDDDKVSYTEYAVAYGAAPIEDYFPIDIHKIKYHLLKGTDLTKELLLQALRWRITQTSDEIRCREMELYIRNNLFGLKVAKKECQFTGSIIKNCLEREPDANGEINDVQSNAARILNCFASLKVGRDYLCQDEQFLTETLLPFVINEKYDSVIVQDMLIATLQKLSLRKRARQLMIEGGLIQYLVTFLTNNYESLNDYCLEYSVALLMNLCLQREAKSVCKSISREMVSLLTTILYTTRECCMPYVNGTLFAILRDKTINADAKDGKLGAAILEQAKLTKSEENKNQLEFIYRMHVRDNFDMCPCRSNTGPENELDLLEPELDISDGVRSRFYGESLLQFYRLGGIQGSDGGQSSLKCFCKPASLNRNVKPYNVAEQGIVTTRKNNSVKVTYEVYLDPAEKDKLIKKIEQEDAECRSIDQQLDDQCELEREKKKVSFKSSDSDMREVFIIGESSPCSDEQQIPEQEGQLPSIQEEEQQPEMEEKGQQVELQEEESQTEVELLQVTEQQSQTEEELLQLAEQQSETEEEHQQETEEEHQQETEEQEQKQEAGEEDFDQTESEQFETLEILKEAEESVFPSIVQYETEDILSEGRNSNAVYVQTESTENEKKNETETLPNIDSKRSGKKPTRKPVPKYTKHSQLTKPGGTAPDYWKQRKAHWDPVQPKPKPKLTEYKQPKPILAQSRQPKPLLPDTRHPKSRCERNEQPRINEKQDMHMPVSYFGCYRNYSDVGRLFLNSANPCTYTSTTVCPDERTKRNKYSCGCYDKIKCYVAQLDNNCCNKNPNHRCSNNAYACYNMMGLTSPEVETSTPDNSSHTINLKNNKVNVVSSTDDVDMTIPYYNCEVLCESSKIMQSNQCHYYKVVFQSRPKIGRTPPH
ncbi:uncharacterized protein LOC108735663 isoform X2 [Agrilus planipennis]|uniref:Uncharacterized protein LOC108735663 isoform X2 n=1 Tax=Agrilus planipennis TaxID=224129 RepID=A0A7F5R3S7_AGRPL|nr:uncharacterized protein LOC108735663 isoform X2 [Agrilus planipennis]